MGVAITRFRDGGHGSVEVLVQVCSDDWESVGSGPVSSVLLAEGIQRYAKRPMQRAITTWMIAWMREVVYVNDMCA